MFLFVNQQKVVLILFQKTNVKSREPNFWFSLGDCTGHGHRLLIILFDFLSTFVGYQQNIKRFYNLSVKIQRNSKNIWKKEYIAEKLSAAFL